MSGVLSTSSNLIFYGTFNSWFKAVDAKNGKDLWRYHIGFGSVSKPFTYSLKGHQYNGTYCALGGWASVVADLAYCGNHCGALGFNGEFAQIRKHNARPSGGAINIFSL